MPQPTDLVTDLPADFEVFGQAVATSLADLLGGTTDQVLAKNSNTDMDFKWVTSDDANAIQNTIVDAKGDLIAATAADTPARLAVGANGTILVADSTASEGMAWKQATRIVQIVTATTNTTKSTSSSTLVDSNLTATITPTSASNKILVFATQNGCIKEGSNTSIKLFLRRGATDISYMVGYGAYTNSSAANNIGTVSTVFLDSPATTSATTYKTMVSSEANTAQILVQHAGEASTITLMEITP
jgi:hypothetical protein